MATISELVAQELAAGKKLGEIRIRSESWHKIGWFAPYFYAEWRWHGHDGDYGRREYTDAGGDWQLYVEPAPPKKTKQVWQWAHRLKGRIQWSASQVFRSDEEAEAVHNHNPDCDYIKIAGPYEVPE